MSARPTIARLRELFDLDKETGHLTRRITTSNRCPAGSRAGTLDTSTGYRKVRVDGRILMEHIVICAMHTGEWPTAQVDHRNTITHDNRPDNLRPATHGQNQQNRRRARTDNKLGVLGVIQVGERFAASLRINGRQTRLGTYDTAEQAHIAHVAAKRVHHEGCTL